MNKNDEKRFELWKGITYLLISLLILSGIGACLIFRDSDQRLTDIESTLGIKKQVPCSSGIGDCYVVVGVKEVVNPLVGWSEECIQNKTTEKHEYIENPQLTNLDAKNCSLSCNASIYINKNGFVYIADNTTLIQSTCTSSCMIDKLHQLQPYVRFWNETICTKKMLVKEVTE